MFDHHRQLNQPYQVENIWDVAPTGLTPKVSSTISLSKNLKEKRDDALSCCSRNLLDILITHHSNEVEKLRKSRGEGIKILTNEELTRSDNKIWKTTNPTSPRKYQKNERKFFPKNKKVRNIILRT